MTTEPAWGRSRPPSTESSVVFPDPDAPVTATTGPASTSKSCRRGPEAVLRSVVAEVERTNAHGNVRRRCLVDAVRRNGHERDGTVALPIPARRRARPLRLRPSASTAARRRTARARTRCGASCAVARSRPSTACSPRLMRCVITNAGGTFDDLRDVRVRARRVEHAPDGLRRVLGRERDLAVVEHELVEVAEVLAHVVVGDRGRLAARRSPRARAGTRARRGR